MKRDGRLSLKVRLGVVLLALAVVMPAAGGGLMAIRSATGAGPVVLLVGRVLFGRFKSDSQERTDRSAVNERRDAEKDEVDQEQQILDFTHDTGWLNNAVYEQESTRLVKLKAGIDELALRERQTVSFQARHRARRDLGRALGDAVALHFGVNPKSVRFAESLFRGNKPITALIDAATAGGPAVDPLEQFRELRTRLLDLKDGLRFVRGSAGKVARAELSRLLGEVTGLPVNTSEEAEEALDAVRGLGTALEDVVDQAGAITRDLAPQSSRIDRQRFVDNPRWIKAFVNVQTLSSSEAENALAANFLLAVTEKAVKLLAGSGVTLTPDQLLAMAQLAASDPSLSIDETVQEEVNELLAAAAAAPTTAAPTTAPPTTAAPTTAPPTTVPPTTAPPTTAPPTTAPPTTAPPTTAPPTTAPPPAGQEATATGIVKWYRTWEMTPRGVGGELRNEIWFRFNPEVAGPVTGEAHLETKGIWLEQCGAEQHHYRLDVWFTGTYNAEMSWQDINGTYSWKEDFLYYEFDQGTGECTSEHLTGEGSGVEWNAVRDGLGVTGSIGTDHAFGFATDWAN